MADTEKPIIKSQPLIREGFILAAISATAYYVAFSFETGYADCFGYPHWAIEVSSLSIIIAWASIAGFLLLASIFYLSLGLFIPVRTFRIFVFNRPTGLLLSFGCMAFGMGGIAGQFDIPALLYVMGIIVAVLLILMADIWGKAYRYTDKTLPILDRIDLANKLFAGVNDLEANRGFLGTRTVFVHTLQHPLFGPFLIRGTFILLAIYFGGGLARSYGSYSQASRTWEFFTFQMTRLI